MERCCKNCEYYRFLTKQCTYTSEIKKIKQPSKVVCIMFKEIKIGYMRSPRRDKMKWLLVLIPLTILLLSGCTDMAQRETGTWMKEGKVIKIEYNQPFGGTFSDYYDYIIFEDGTHICSQRHSLSSIVLNKTGRFFFEKNDFTYNGVRYEFDNFIRVEYEPNLEI